jgi:hypothetical protein
VRSIEYSAEASDMRSSRLSSFSVCSISTPWRVSIFITRVMTVCSSACSSSWLGTPASMNTGTLPAPHRYTPSSTRQCRAALRLQRQR